MKSALLLTGVWLLVPLGVAMADQRPSRQRTPQMSQESRGAEEDAIREAVFRFTTPLRGWNAGNTRVFYLGVEPGHQEPSEALLNRLAGHKPPVQAFPAGTGFDIARINRRSNKKLTVEVVIGPIDWKNPSLVEVHASDWAGPKMAMQGTFRARKFHGRWIVGLTNRPLVEANSGQGVRASVS